MTRALILAALAAMLFAGPAEARLIKEMQVTRSGKLDVEKDGQASVYRLLLNAGKVIVLGDREFFAPATRAALDQAVERKLTVEATGHLLIFNDQSPVFALPVAKVDVKGLDLKPSAATDQKAAQDTAVQPQSSQDARPFMDSMLKNKPSPTVGKALENYAFFSSRSWRMLEPGKAEFRGDLNLGSITQLDSHYVERLRSKDLNDTFKSITFVAHLTMRSGGTVECPDPAIEAVFQDGTKDRLVWKDPPGYYWDRIYQNRKIKVDYFLSKASLNPKYGKGMSPAAQ